MTNISVIIPIYNAELTISNLLFSLSCQDVECKYDIIIVNNESTDSTDEILRKTVPQLTVPVKVLFQPKGVTIATIRNYGARHSKGKVLAFIDSDCVPPLDWLREGLKLIECFSEDVLVAGGCQPPPSGTWVERAWHSTRSGHKNGTFVHGANFFIPRRLFEKIGGFNENLETSEDYDLGRRVSHHHRVVSMPKLAVTHFGEANTLTKKFRKEWWYSKNSLSSFWDNKFHKPFWTALFFLLTIISLPFSSSYGRTTFLSSIFILLALPTSFSFFLCARAKDYHFFIMLVPVCFVYLLGRAFGILDGFISIFFKLVKYKV